jgi:hypothetical protein
MYVVRSVFDRAVCLMVCLYIVQALSMCKVKLNCSNKHLDAVSLGRLNIKGRKDEFAYSCVQQGQMRYANQPSRRD